MSFPLSFIGMPGFPELLIVAVIVLLLFGKRLPGVMGSLGKSIVEFKKGVSGIEDEVDKVNKEIEDKVIDGKIDREPKK